MQVLLSYASKLMLFTFKNRKPAVDNLLRKILPQCLFCCLFCFSYLEETCFYVISFVIVDFTSKIVLPVFIIQVVKTGRLLRMVS